VEAGGCCLGRKRAPAFANMPRRRSVSIKGENMTRIVVLGGGYAGLRTVRRLAAAKLDAELILVNKNSYHYQSTQLHQVAAGTKDVADVTFDIKHFLPKVVEFVLDEVTEIQRADKRILLRSGKNLNYDYLVNALGFESESFGIPGVEENSLPLVDIETAERARIELESHLAHYAQSHDVHDLAIAVCGAGFTSIEYLGELVYRLPSLAKQYHFPIEEVSISCIEAADKMLPMFTRDLSSWAEKYLVKHGVTFHTSTPITAIEPGKVVSNEKSFFANTIIWATGVKGSSVVADSGYAQKRNRVMVQDDLSVEGSPHEFVIGDVSAVMDSSSQRPYPTTAQISMAQADCAAHNIAALLQNRPSEKFTFSSTGTVCSLGPFAGVAQINMLGHWKLKGKKVAMVKKIINDRSTFELAGMKAALESN
jgi:NADH:ubiquinone reductase (H+-translocating)